MIGGRKRLGPRSRPYPNLHGCRRELGSSGLALCASGAERRGAMRVSKVRQRVCLLPRAIESALHLGLTRVAACLGPGGVLTIWISLHNGHVLAQQARGNDVRGHACVGSVSLSMNQRASIRQVDVNAAGQAKTIALIGCSPWAAASVCWPERVLFSVLIAVAHPTCHRDNWVLGREESVLEARSAACPLRFQSCTYLLVNALVNQCDTPLHS
jgi:hypothetical protein